MTPITDSARSSRRRGLTGLIIAGAAASLMLGAVAPAASAAPADATRSAEHLEKRDMTVAAWAVLQPVPEIRCPAGTTVSDEKYHKNTAWSIPHGLEIRNVTNVLFDAAIYKVLDGTKRVGVGGFLSTVSNPFGGEQKITFVLHCV